MFPLLREFALKVVRPTRALETEVVSFLALCGVLDRILEAKRVGPASYKSLGRSMLCTFQPGALPKARLEPLTGGAERVRDDAMRADGDGGRVVRVLPIKKRLGATTRCFAKRRSLCERIWPPMPPIW